LSLKEAFASAVSRSSSQGLRIPSRTPSHHPKPSDESLSNTLFIIGCVCQEAFPKICGALGIFCSRINVVDYVLLERTDRLVIVSVCAVLHCRVERPFEPRTHDLANRLQNLSKGEQRAQTETSNTDMTLRHARHNCELGRSSL
jgi:hypothetical protein